MNRSLEAYADIVGTPVIRQLRALGDRLRGLQVVHVNSTSQGGGVEEILSWMVPLMRDLGLEASWKVIRGTPPSSPSPNPTITDCKVSPYP